ncbi:MAG TPA: 30S ribosomal protein S6 [Actinobacteria bacterium]|nr:30S ribosomal protein S6 [Actinomycetota bacterium]
MRPYEIMIIHRPELAEDDVRSAIADLEKAIAESGVHESTDFWGKRRFAYEIDHVNEGYYSVVEFRAEPDLLAVLDRALSLSDAVIRHKIIRREA